MKVFIIIFFISCSFLSFGQDTLTIASDSTIIDTVFNEGNHPKTIDNTSTTRFFEIGISPTSYKGELSSYDHWSMGWNIGLLLTRKKRINSEFSVFIGNISGQNSNFLKQENTNPNTFFRTSFFSGSYNLHLNIIAKKRFKFYVSQGIGIMNFSPQNANYDKLIDLVETRAINEIYNTTTIVLPTQIGMHYSLKNHFNLGVKISWLNTRTDYLDNISEWGDVDNNDNMMAYKIYVLIPIPSRK